MAATTLSLGPYRYRPGKQIDETRMSTLWLAGEVTREGTLSPGDQVIIKIARMTETQYSLTNQRAIENEEKWLVRLDHPNVIRLRPVAERISSRQTVYRARSELPGNPWFLVTDYLPGGDLQSFLNDRRKLPASLALEIAEQLGDALTYLHARHCVHCDIKPRNILFHERPSGYGLSQNTRPIVIDFGIAKNPTDGPQIASGTPRWITPELSEALKHGRKLQVDPSWDVYAAGLVLYAMVTGRKPELDQPGSQSWTRLSVADLAGDSSVKQASHLVDGLNELIAGTTADAPADRSNAGTFTDEVRKLRAYVRKPVTDATPVSAAAAAAAVRQKSVPQKQSRDGRWLALAGGGAALLLVGALFMARDVIFSSPSPAGGTPVAAIVSAGTPVAAASPVVSPPAAATHTATAVAKSTRGPTSTPVDTPTRTRTPPPTATWTPRPPTPTRIAVAAAAAVVLPTKTPPKVPPMTPTKTPLPSTATALPFTATPTRRPATPTSLPPTGAQATPVPPTSATSVEMHTQIREPVDYAEAQGEKRFAWTASRELNANECFEVKFWEGSPDNWPRGSGIAAAGRYTSVSRPFTVETAESWLRTGVTYYWGVVLIADCRSYKSSPKRLVSEVRHITYRE